MSNLLNPSRQPVLSFGGITIGVAGGGPRGPWPPLEKLVILAGQKWDLGRTEMRAWQDRNGSLAGHIWELGRTEMGAWQNRNESSAGQKWDLSRTEMGSWQNRNESSAEQK